jgi:hypothetical protein
MGFAALYRSRDRGVGEGRIGFAALYGSGNRGVGAGRMGFAALYPSYALLPTSVGRRLVAGGRRLSSS